MLPGQPCLKIVPYDGKWHRADIQEELVECFCGKTAAQGSFGFFPHFHDLHIATAVVQIVGRIVDHDLPQFIDGVFVRLEAGGDKFPRFLFCPAVVVDTDVQDSVDAEGKGTNQRPVFTDAVRKSVIHGAGVIFHVGRPSFVGTGTAQNGHERRGCAGPVVDRLVEVPRKSFMGQRGVETVGTVGVPVVDVDHILIGIIQRRRQIKGWT